MNECKQKILREEKRTLFYSWLLILSVGKWLNDVLHCCLWWLNLVFSFIVVVVVVIFAVDYIFMRILTLHLRALSTKYWQIVRGMVTFQKKKKDIHRWFDLIWGQKWGRISSRAWAKYDKNGRISTKFQMSNQLVRVTPNRWPKNFFPHFSSWALLEPLVHMMKKVLFSCFSHVFCRYRSCERMHKHAFAGWNTHQLDPYCSL